MGLSNSTSRQNIPEDDSAGLWATLILGTVVALPFALGWISQQITKWRDSKPITPIDSGTVIDSRPQKPGLSTAPARPAEKAAAEKPSTPLDLASRNLTDLALQGKLKKVYGREGEIQTILQRLSSQEPQSILLVGEDGVGKTTLVEGLATQMARNPEYDRYCFLEFNPSDLKSGATARGSLSARMKALFEELTIKEPEGLLYVAVFDEIHRIIDEDEFAETLSQALRNSRLVCIGITTPAGMDKINKADSTLLNAFKVIKVAELDAELPGQSLKSGTTYLILHEIAGESEQKFAKVGLKIQREALEASIDLAERYLGQEKRPGKATRLLEEGIRRLTGSGDEKPSDIFQLENRIRSMQVRLGTLGSDSSDTIKIKDERNQLAKKIEEAQDQLHKLNQNWDLIRKGYEEIASLLKKYDSLAQQAVQAKKNQLDPAFVHNLEQSRDECLTRIKAITESLQPLYAQGFRWMKRELTGDDIAVILSEQTGIPIQRTTAEEKKRLVSMEEELHRRVVGQDEAIAAVSNAVRRARTGYSKGKKPIGSFLFLGPSGVGKTELAKTLAEFLFGDEEKLIRIDLSEYREAHTVSRLIGPPPGYVGSDLYGQGVLLTDRVEQNPYSVVLFDEFEQANPAIHTLLLQILDDGRLTDGRNKTVSFQNTVIILTSNIGQTIIREKGVQEAVDDIEELLKENFPIQLLGRLPRIYFHSLTEDQFAQIIENHLNQFSHDYNIQLTPQAKAWLVEKNYSKEFGARPLIRALDDNVLGLLARLDLREEFIKNVDRLLVELKPDQSGLSFYLIHADGTQVDLNDL